MKRTETRKIMVGNVQIGGQNKVVIQSMCNTKTKNVEDTVNQILELEKAGCEIIRVACLDIEDAKAIKKIKEKIHIPIVADIHYDYRIALEAINSGVDKVRINPGNIGTEERVKAVVDKCKEKNIPIRIGVNAGSLEKDLLEKYGKPTAKAMVESETNHARYMRNSRKKRSENQLEGNNVSQALPISYPEIELEKDLDKEKEKESILSGKPDYVFPDWLTDSMIEEIKRGHPEKYLVRTPLAYLNHTVGKNYKYLDKNLKPESVTLN